MAPNGTRIQIGSAESVIQVPRGEQSFELTRIADAAWNTGRAGMRYRNLLPSRQGGRFGASHIHIAEPGKVKDYVHYHEVRFQLIYCHRGEVRVVYEDQGEPFLLGPGDCVLQPPRIRHRVLESSGGLDVVEVSCPAEHNTVADRSLRLPTPTLNRGRDYSGQKFVRCHASEAKWITVGKGIEARNLGIDAGTNGLATALVVRAREGARVRVRSTPTEFLFRYLLKGSARLECEGEDPVDVVEGDAWHVPQGKKHSLVELNSDVEYLEVVLPGRPRAPSFVNGCK
jgi:quercetin dioxygenase-like cupin family protein